MGSKRIMNVATPTMSTDAATKEYVDLIKADIAKLQTDYLALIASVTRPIVHMFTRLVEELMSMSTATSSFAPYTYIGYWT